MRPMRVTPTCAARAAQVGVTRIGRISAEAGLRLVDRDGLALPNTFGAFDHFSP
jgi:thiamine-monophosphate kinase